MFGSNKIGNVSTQGNHSPVVMFQGNSFHVETPEGKLAFISAFQEMLNNNPSLKHMFEGVYGKLDSVHDDVKKILTIVGNGSLGDIETKLQQALQAKENVERVLGELQEEFKDEIQIKNLIEQAKSVFERGNIFAFDAIMDEAISLKEKLYKQNIAKMYYSKAEAWISGFNYQKSHQNLKKAIQYDPDNIEYLLYLSKYELELAYYDDAIKTTQHIIHLLKDSPDSKDLATSYNNLGMAYDAKGAYDTAIEYYNKSLSIKLKTLGGDHPSVATSYNNLGGAYHNKGAYDTAIEYYNKSLSISLKTLGGDHPDVATSYNNLGMAYRAKGAYDTAIEYYNKSLTIRLKTLGMTIHLLPPVIIILGWHMIIRERMTQRLSIIINRLP